MNLLYLDSSIRWISWFKNGRNCDIYYALRFLYGLYVFDRIIYPGWALPFLQANLHDWLILCHLNHDQARVSVYDGVDWQTTPERTQDTRGWRYILEVKNAMANRQMRRLSGVDWYASQSVKSPRRSKRSDLCLRISTLEFPEGSVHYILCNLGMYSYHYLTSKIFKCIYFFSLFILFYWKYLTTIYLTVMVLDKLYYGFGLAWIHILLCDGIFVGSLWAVRISIVWKFYHMKRTHQEDVQSWVQ